MEERGPAQVGVDTAPVGEGNRVVRAQADGLGEVRLSGGNSLSERFAERQVGRDCRGKGASGPMSVGSIDKLGFEKFEKSPVIQQVCRPVL